ncbi:MSHA biogenesis protein MshP [Aeromonas schubertii]
MPRDLQSMGHARGSALMIALFVIVVMALLAAAMGRFLTGSGEKHTLEVRSTRALLAAQSGIEVALYRLFPNRTAAQQHPSPICEANRTLTFSSQAGLKGCQAVVRCAVADVLYQGTPTRGYRLESVGTCGQVDLTSANPDLVASRTVLAEAFDGATP